MTVRWDSVGHLPEYSPSNLSLLALLWVIYLSPCRPWFPFSESYLPKSSPSNLSLLTQLWVIYLSPCALGSLHLVDHDIWILWIIYPSPPSNLSSL